MAYFRLHADFAAVELDELARDVEAEADGYFMFSRIISPPGRLRSLAKALNTI